LCRNSIGVAESSIRDDLGLTLTQSGWFLGAFFWTYALGQVPAGWLGQRWGTRQALYVYAAAWSLGAAMLGMADTLLLLLAAQGIAGAAQAGLFPCCVNTISHWIPVSRRAICCAFLSVGMQLGAAAAAVLTGVLIEAVHWRWTFLLYALPGLLWSMQFFDRFRDRPQDDPTVNDAELALIHGEDAPRRTGSEIHEPPPWLGMLTSPSLYFLCAQQMCRAAGYAFFATWFPTFLQETRGVDVEQSGYLQAAVFCASLLGGLSGGTVVDWLFRRTGSLRWSRGGMGFASTAACGALILSAFFTDETLSAVMLLAAGAFAAAFAGPCAYVTTIDLGGRHVPQVFAIMNMAGNLAAAATPVAVGWLFSRMENWNLILGLFAAVYLAAAVCWSLVDPGRKIG
ncbi:MAG: MFS transporter, partial [Planctomycetaceae bacterium]